MTAVATTTPCRADPASDAGRYLTDGVSLYRVVTDDAAPTVSGFVLLENCLTLATVLVEDRELDLLQLVAT